MFNSASWPPPFNAHLCFCNIVWSSIGFVFTGVDTSVSVGTCFYLPALRYSKLHIKLELLPTKFINTWDYFQQRPEWNVAWDFIHVWPYTGPLCVVGATIVALHFAMYVRCQTIFHECTKRYLLWRCYRKYPIIPCVSQGATVVLLLHAWSLVSL